APELERICLRALSKQISDRYTTARDMAEELCQAAEVCHAKGFEGPVDPKEEEHNQEPLDALVLASGTAEGTHPLTKDRVAIGRSPDCDIMLTDAAVGRFHAQLVRDGGRYLIEDLQSRNGTYVNGHQVKSRVPLKDG